MKDRIGNVLAQGDKVLVDLGTSTIIGVVSNLEEMGLVAVQRGSAAEMKPGRVLIACVIALPVVAEANAVAQVVKVYDADKEATQALVQGAMGVQRSSRSN